MVLFDFSDGKYEHVIYLFQLLVLYTDPSKSSLLFSLSVSIERVMRNLVFHWISWYLMRIERSMITWHPSYSWQISLGRRKKIRFLNGFFRTERPFLLTHSVRRITTMSFPDIPGVKHIGKIHSLAINGHICNRQMSLKDHRKNWTFMLFYPEVCSSP